MRTYEWMRREMGERDPDTLRALVEVARCTRNPAILEPAIEASNPNDPNLPTLLEGFASALSGSGPGPGAVAPETQDALGRVMDACLNHPEVDAWGPRVLRHAMRFAQGMPRGFSALACRVGVERQSHERVVELVLQAAAEDDGMTLLLSTLPPSLYTQYARCVLEKNMDVERALDMALAARGGHPWERRIRAHLGRALLLHFQDRDVVCPLSLEVMEDPVVVPIGISYERAWIERWIEEHHTDPTTRLPLYKEDLVENRNLKHILEIDSSQFKSSIF
jgi:hypothetical protein